MDPKNRKLIRNIDVVFNEDSILSERNQPKSVDKRVSLDTDNLVVEGPTHRAESKNRQIVETDQIANTHMLTSN